MLPDRVFIFYAETGMIIILFLTVSISIYFLSLNYNIFFFNVVLKLIFLQQDEANWLMSISIWYFYHKIFYSFKPLS